MHHSQQESTRLSKHRYWTAQVELSAVTVKEEPGPAGPSCNTLEIYHKDPQDRKVSVMVEKAEYLLCPACGIACSAAAGLYAHMATCHSGLAVTFEKKVDRKAGRQRATTAIGRGAQRWKLHLTCGAQAQNDENDGRAMTSWEQNFLFWVRTCWPLLPALRHCCIALQFCFSSRAILEFLVLFLRVCPRCYFYCVFAT